VPQLSPARWERKRRRNLKKEKKGVESTVITEEMLQLCPVTRGKRFP
jgi:hypothetical protein